MSVIGLFPARKSGTSVSARLYAPAAVLVAWLCICGSQLTHELESPGKIAAALLGLLVLLPLVLLKAVRSRIPVYLLAAYAASVPFADLLATNAGPTFTKILGGLTGMTLLWSIAATQRSVPVSKPFIALFVLTMYLGATIFWAIDPAQAVNGFFTYLSPIVLFAVIALFPFSIKDVKIIVAATIAGALLAAIYGDQLFWQGSAVAGARLYIGWNAASSIDPNEFATALLVPIAVSLTMFVRTRAVLAKLSWLTALAALLSGFAVSGSRGATLGFVAMVMFLSWRTRYKSQIIGVCVITALAIIASPTGQRFMESDLSNGSGRADVWKIGIASLKQYWLAGAGVGNFNQAYMQYFLSVPHQPIQWDRVAHSIFVGTAVELGIVGFALVMYFWYLQFNELARVRGNTWIVDLCTALRAGLLALFIAGFSLSIMTAKYTWLAFSLVAVVRSALLAGGRNIDPPRRVPLKPS